MQVSKGGETNWFWKLRSQALLIGCLALALRVSHIHESAASPFFDAPVIDARTYTEMALDLARGAWAGALKPFWQPPLYPYFLASIFWVGGENYYWPRLVQALLGAGSCILLLAIGHRLFTPGIALGAALGAACYGPFIYFDGELLPASLAVFLNLLFFFLVIRSPYRDPGRWVLTGVLMGLAALTVVNILLFLPVLVWWLWRLDDPIPKVDKAKRAVYLLLGCALIIAPVTVRNYVVSGDWVLISHNAGINFYIGNNPHYERTVNIRPGKDWALLVEKPEIEAGIERPSVKSHYFFAQSWQFISADPLGYLGLLAHKLRLFWRGDEIQRNLDPYYARRDSTVLRLLLWKYGLAFPFGLVAPLALIGMACLWRRSDAGAATLAALFLLVYMFSVVLFFVTSRYRLPAVPFALLLASFGLSEMLRFRQRKIILWPLFAALILAVNIGIGSMDMAGSAEEHFARGDAYMRKGMQADALYEFRIALERQPDHGEALLRLAALYAERREHVKAIEAYSTYVKKNPEVPPARFLLGNAFLAARRYPEAIVQYENLTALRPDWAALFGRLGYAYLMAGRPILAASAYRRTLEIRPDSSVVRYQLARLYETQDSLAAATREYRRLLDDEPERAELHTRLANLLVAQEGAQQRTLPLEPNARISEAEAHHRQAVELAPDDVAGGWGLGMMLAKLGRYKEAIGHFRRVLELDPQMIQTHFCLANLYKRTGEEAAAQEHMARYARANREKRLEHKAQRQARQQVEEIFGGMGAKK